MPQNPVKCPCGCEEIHKRYSEFVCFGEPLAGRYWMSCGHFIERKWEPDAERVITSITGFRKMPSPTRRPREKPFWEALNDKHQQGAGVR